MANKTPKELLEEARVYLMKTVTKIEKELNKLPCEKQSEIIRTEKWDKDYSVSEVLLWQIDRKASKEFRFYYKDGRDVVVPLSSIPGETLLEIVGNEKKSVLGKLVEKIRDQGALEESLRRFIDANTNCERLFRSICS